MRKRKFDDGEYRDIKIERAIEERMYLLDQKESSSSTSLSRRYAVLGSTGNVYDVRISARPSCTCPNFERSPMCKHILFALIKVLHVDHSSSLLWQSTYTRKQIAELFAKAPRTTATVLARREVISAYKHSVGEKEDVPVANEETTIATAKDTAVDTAVDTAGKVDEETECPICFERCELAGKEETDQCGVCNNAVHLDCIQRWLDRSETCPLCRSSWTSLKRISKKPSKKRSRCKNPTGFINEEGYLNLGDLQNHSY